MATTQPQKTSYKTLEDLSFLGNSTPKYDGGAASFFASSTFLYTLFFIIIIGAAFYQYVMVGIYRLEASENGIKKSNDTFRRATLGLLGVFGLFLLLGAVNKDLLLGDVGLSALRSKGGGSSTVPTTVSPQSGSGCKASSCDPVKDLARITGDADIQIRTDLTANGVGINKSGCTSVGQDKCTNVGGLPDDVIQMTKKLKLECNCRVTISGGTEWWSHSTHGPGISAVDLQIPDGNPTDDSLFRFLNGKPEGGVSTNCTSIHVWNNWSFCDEKSGATAKTTGRHWHVSH
jgi:hypothetical protein